MADVDLIEHGGDEEINAYVYDRFLTHVEITNDISVIARRLQSDLNKRYGPGTWYVVVSRNDRRRVDSNYDYWTTGWKHAKLSIGNVRIIACRFNSPPEEMTTDIYDGVGTVEDERVIVLKSTNINNKMRSTIIAELTKLCDESQNLSSICTDFHSYFKDIDVKRSKNKRNWLIVAQPRQYHSLGFAGVDEGPVITLCYENMIFLIWLT